MKVTDLVTQLAQPVVESFGCELWDVEYVREGSERYLRIYLDKDGGIDIEDCEKVHRAMDCLAGAIYAAMANEGDFDTAMITAVNHSGYSSAVASIAGAILGAKMGDSELPDFYLESLEVVKPLRQLADDMVSFTPTKGLFDDDWDMKYVQGLPLV